MAEVYGPWPGQELGNGWAEAYIQTSTKMSRDLHGGFRCAAAFRYAIRLRRYDAEYRWISDQGVADTTRKETSPATLFMRGRHGAGKQRTGFAGSEERMSLAAEAPSRNVGVGLEHG